VLYRTDKYNYYHSFPRRFRLERRSNSEQIKKGLEIFESILRFGILLVPEVVEFEGELDVETGTVTSELLAIQRRFCLTHLTESQLKSHALSFGSFHLEFTEDSIRKLGAIPVFYIPKSSPSKTSGLSILGNTLLHRLSEIQDILEILSELSTALTNKSLFSKKLKLASNRDEKEFLRADLSWLLDSLSEEKQSFKELAATIEVLSYMFYPTNRNAESTSEDNIFYYLQREWRIIGGISLNMKQVDKYLTAHEKQHISSIDQEFFFRPFSRLLESNAVIDECEIIRDIDGISFKYFINKIFAPLASKKRLEHILSVHNADIEVIYTNGE
jgi:hypothetical protein